MFDCKYWENYKISFMAFKHLVTELVPFLRLTTYIFAKPFISIKKQMSLVLYQLTHDFSYKIMDDLYNCGEFTIRKHTLIVCRVFFLSR